MIPVRVLVVEESWALARQRQRQLEAVEGFEVLMAASPAAGMLALARYRPDLLVLGLVSGGGATEEWRRAVQRHRASRPLSLLVLADRLSAREHAQLDAIADLGVHGRAAEGQFLETILTAWADRVEPLREVA